MIIYPIAVFNNKMIKKVGSMISIAAVEVLIIKGLLNPPVYRTDIMGNGEENRFDDTYSGMARDQHLH